MNKLKQAADDNNLDLFKLYLVNHTTILEQILYEDNVDDYLTLREEIQIYCRPSTYEDDISYGTSCLFKDLLYHNLKSESCKIIKLILKEKGLPQHGYPIFPDKYLDIINKKLGDKKELFTKDEYNLIMIHYFNNENLFELFYYRPDQTECIYIKNKFIFDIDTSSCNNKEIKEYYHKYILQFSNYII